MTRNLSRTVLLAAVALAMGGVWADTETVDGCTWTYRIDGGTAEIYNEKGGEGTTAISPSPAGVVTIPATLSGVSVTSIGEAAFFSCTNMTGVVIPGSVTNIGANAFEGCCALRGVTIPEGVMRIGEKAFYNCSSMMSVSIPASVEAIGIKAFDGCRVLGSVAVPQCVCARYLSKTFQSYLKITNVVISAGVTQIGDEVFSGCPVTSVTIPGSVTNIGARAFSNCSGLVRVIFEGDAPTVGVDVFAGIATNSCEMLISSSSSGWDDPVWTGFQWAYGCSVSFDANGGVCPVARRVVVQGSAIGDLPVPDLRTGYAFEGWFSAVNGGDRILSGDVVYADRQVYAHWTPDQYLVTFDANGGEGGTSGLMAYESALVAPTVTREGYMFAGWLPQVAATVPLGGATYTAQWTESSWLVILDANGGSCGMESLTVECGAAIGALPVPVREYHEFLGWFTAVEGGDRVNAATEVNGSLILYAHWRALFEGGWTQDQNGVWISGVTADATTNTLSMTVSGAGTITFSWKVSCEDYFNFKGTLLRQDGLAFFIDGTETNFVNGVMSEWEECSFEIASAGSHTLTWSYIKDSSGAEGEDCAWVDAVTWTPTDGLAAWLAERNLAADTVAANGRTVAECYALGLDPTDATNDFRIVSISMVDGKPHVEWEPKTNRWTGAELDATLKGAANLGDPWQIVPAGGNPAFRFFTVVVDQP